MSEYIVEMRHVTKRFPGIVANDDVSLGIKKGEIFALLGENGIFVAEVLAWMGADLILIPSYFLTLKKHQRPIGSAEST